MYRRNRQNNIAMNYQDYYKTIKSYKYMDEELIESMEKEGYVCIAIEYDPETVSETNLYEYLFKYNQPY